VGNVRRAIAVTAVLAGTAVVATLPADVGAAPQTQTWTTPGTSTWVVPDGVTEIEAVVSGAAGGDSETLGGKGGGVQATIPVTPGETLTISVGGRGDDEELFLAAGGAGGAGGGGAGGSSPGRSGGGGGGASDIRQGGSALSDRVVVAGGGGGAGGDCDGDGGVGGGQTPTAGSGAVGGQPGTASAGGAAGTVAATAGVAGLGGTGANAGSANAGGGGGGGWYGGGGGGAGSGGGGGSSYVTPSATDVVFADGARSGDGAVTISWVVNPTTTTAPATTSTTTTTVVPAGPVSSFGPSASAGWSVLTVPPGAVIQVSSDGWMPGSPVTFTMFSTPTDLGTVPASSTGTAMGYFQVPASATDGAHLVVMSGTSAAGTPASVSLPLTILAATTPAAAPAAAPVGAPLAMAC
jgi:hypothetical protein